MMSWGTIEKWAHRWQPMVRRRFGMRPRLRAPDRIFQEERLLPIVLEDGRVRKVLYVGVAWYTRYYYRAYFQHAELTTLDIAPEQAVFGFRRHITGGLDASQLACHGPFDAIFLLGILSYGINDLKSLHTELTHVSQNLTDVGCCYINVEKRHGASIDCTLRLEDVITCGESIGMCTVPISDWLEMVDGKGEIRFLVMGRSQERITDIVARLGTVMCIRDENKA